MLSANHQRLHRRTPRRQTQGPERRSCRAHRRQITAAKYDYHEWLADAARRVAQIQAVTHVLKATHPDARGTNLHVVPNSLPRHAEIGTHLLSDNFADDIVGNAAALDVYKFLKLEVESRRLLDWLQADDADLLRALHEDAATADQWAAAFKRLVRSPAALASHGLAKQVYWCMSGKPADDGGFHLLQPLFSSSLAHAMHQEINDVRFGEANKAARQARRDKKAHDAPYRDYRNLAIRKLGGTKPQNISQLNSERGGLNYLLSSLPPRWDQERPRQFLFIDSALAHFRRFEGVGELLDALLALLESRPAPTLDTRLKRDPPQARTHRTRPGSVLGRFRPRQPATAPAGLDTRPGLPPAAVRTALARPRACRIASPEGCGARAGRRSIQRGIGVERLAGPGGAPLRQLAQRHPATARPARG